MPWATVPGLLLSKWLYGSFVDLEYFEFWLIYAFPAPFVGLTMAIMTGISFETHAEKVIAEREQEQNATRAQIVKRALIAERAQIDAQNQAQLKSEHAAVVNEATASGAGVTNFAAFGFGAMGSGIVGDVYFPSSYWFVGFGLIGGVIASVVTSLLFKAHAERVVAAEKRIDEEVVEIEEETPPRRESREVKPAGKPKPLTANSSSARAIALALVVMKSDNEANVRECADDLARQSVVIDPDTLLQSTRNLSRAIQEQTVQAVFDKVCEQLRAATPNAQSQHPQIARVLSSLVTQPGRGDTKSATGPKVLRALCRVLESSPT